MGRVSHFSTCDCHSIPPQATLAWPSDRDVAWFGGKVSVAFAPSDALGLNITLIAFDRPTFDFLNRCPLP